MVNKRATVKKVVLSILGIILILLAIPGAILSYHLLPPGRYPAVIIGIGALLPLLAGGFMIRKVNPDLWEFHRRHTGLTALFLIVAFTVIIAVMASLLG